MNSYNFFLFLLIISLGFTMKRVSTLSAEGILHGAIVNITKFQYHAVIFGAPNLDATSSLLCSGALIAAIWILAPVPCFFLNSREVKSLIFKVIVGAENISMGGGAMETIVYVYTEKNSHFPLTNNVAVSKTKNGLPLGRPTGTPQQLSNILALPTLDEEFYGLSGVVSGYGRHTLRNEGDEDGPDTEYILRYTNVEYSRRRECFNDFHNIFTYGKFCGVAGKIEERNTGMCTGDFGNPLVIRNKLVGLSVSSYENCDDTGHGSLYIDVRRFFKFIYAVARGHINSDIQLWDTNYENRWNKLPFPLQIQ